MHRSFLSRAAQASVVLALALPPISAQGAAPALPPAAPATVLDALNASGGTIQDFNLPATRERFHMAIWIGSELVGLELRPNDVRTSDFQLLVSDASGLRAVPTPPSVTWRGEVVGRPGSDVAATITPAGIEALVWLDDSGVVWGIQPARQLDPTRPATEHVVYSSNDLDPLPVHCGVDHDPKIVHAGAPGFGTDARKVAEIAIDCDLEFYQRFNTNVTQVQNHVATVMNGVDTIYQRDIDVQYSITAVIVRTTRTYSNTNMSSLLTEFRNYWNTNQNGTPRDVAHLFTGKGSFSGVIGITQLGVLCNLFNAYGVDKAFSNSLSSNVALVSHELGHDWNAQHCDAVSDCRIMCSGLGGCTGNIGGFGTTSINTMVAFKNSRNCLSNPFPPTLTNVTPGSVEAFTIPPVTVTGSNLGGVTQVTVGSQNAGFAVVDSSTLRVTPPTPTSLGAAPIRATTAIGTSNPLGFSYAETSPPQFVAPTFGLSGYPINFTMGGNPSDLWWILVALNDATTLPFLGYDVLLNHVILTQGQLDGAGLGGFDFPVPANASLAGLQLSSQLVLIGETDLQLADITAVQTVNFLL